MCKSFISIIEMSFYILCHRYSFIKLYLSVDSHILQRLYANKHILNLNKAIAMRFSQNKAVYPVLNTWYSLDKNYITSIFSILFPEGHVLFLTHPVCTSYLQIFSSQMSKKLGFRLHQPLIEDILP